MTKKAIANKEKGLHSDFLKTIIKIQIRGWLKSVITLILNLLFKWVQKLKHLFQLLLSSDRSFGEKFFSHSLQTPGAMQRFELLSGILLIASGNFGLITAQLPNHEVLINSVIRGILKFKKFIRVVLMIRQNLVKMLSWKKQGYSLGKKERIIFETIHLRRQHFLRGKGVKNWPNLLTSSMDL